MTLVVLLVGVVSFGLGRHSVAPLANPAANQFAEQQAAVPAAIPAATTTTLPETAVGETTPTQYVGSRNSDKYHLPWCSGAKRIAAENRVTFASEAAAREAGYSPAANCPGI